MTPSISRLHSLPRAILLVVVLLAGVSAHEHHDPVDIDTSEPLDAILWIHMIVQLVVWGFLFPIGMVLGLSKSRWHVPLQSLNILLTFGGIILGHHHGGRNFPATAHGVVAKIIFWIMIIQGSIGIILKLHLKFKEEYIRPKIKLVHRIIGVIFPILGWLQMLLGVITLLGYCFDGNLGQCLAHYIMGSAFIAYATIMLLMLTVGHAWLVRTGNSQEYLDSWVICIWGIINTFTEHHDAWNKNWSHKDMQHTMMGVLWWTGGALGIFLSRKGKRSFVPAVIIVMTGWGMSAHEQDLMISTKVHALFGYSLMAAGVVRIIEVCFVLQDRPTPAGSIKIVQYIPPYLLTLGGTMFMGGTNEEMIKMDGLGVDHVTYGLFIFSLSFLIFLNILFLINLYTHSGANASLHQDDDRPAFAKEEGYEALDSVRVPESPDGPESFELTETETLQDKEGVGNGIHVPRDEVDYLDGSRPKVWEDKRF